MNISRFWAKTSHDKDLPNAFHPLICHLIDVAAVAQKIWQDVLSTAVKTRISQAFGVEDAGNLVAFIAGLHDLGKCSPPFALRGHNEKGKQTEKLLGLYRPDKEIWQNSAERSICAPHGYVTAVELPQILETFGFNSKFARQISVLIGGHHGVFPNSGWDKKLRENESFLGNWNWKNARIKLVETLAELLEIQKLHQNNLPKLDNAAIMILAGLVSVADWVGSDTQFFGCEVVDFTKDFDVDLKDYLKRAEAQAEKALKQLGWTFEKSENPSKENLSNEKKFEEMFPFIRDRRHLQDMAIEFAEELTSPGIMIIESPMGEGKTEAAMFLAETWNSNLSQKGYYFALPTQATSDQMFGRVGKFLENCFPNQKVNVQLAHGHASLSAEFETLKENHRRLLQDVFDDECKGGECIPNIVAAEWFTYRKRSLLAPFGVGTIDQALMAVLQTRHVFVRLFGLAHKTVIIDEVHAYDAYMSTLLERLLEWLAALGSPVILLSATLPINRRDALIKAYQRGLGVETSEIQTADYPRISYAADSTIKVRHINSSAKTQTLHIEKVGENFIADLKAKLEKEGGCAAIICNTVKRSQNIYEQLSNDEFFKGDADDRMPKLDLLHSRFRFCDRDAIEKRVRLRFGKEGDKIKVTENGKEIEKEVKRPDFAVLVSTQIIEQSLDIDFDLMISDLAPIDLLLQRAGRLHRHDRTRKEKFKEPTLWIIEPPTDEQGNLVADKKGLPDFGKAGVIYDKHILLRAWLILKETKKIEIPSEIEGLIEAVYDLEKSYENSDGNLINLWQTSFEKCLADIENERKQAEYRYIKRPIYSRHISGIFTATLEEDSPEIHKTLQAATRLTEPTANVICLWEKDGKVFLDEKFTREIDLDKKPYLELTKELLRYSVGISSKSVVFQLFAEEVPKGWQESALLRNHRVLKFNENRKCEKFGHVFRIDEKLGLTITKKEDENV